MTISKDELKEWLAGLDDHIPVLHLVMKAKWFDMIDRGEKTEEYREIKRYWLKRIFADRMPDDPKDGEYEPEYSQVRFKRGFARNAPEMIWEIGKLRIGNAKPEIAEGHTGRVIVLELAKRVK